MTHIIEQQNLYLQTTKQRIVRNLNNIDEEIDLEVNNIVDMDGAGTTIREIFMKHLDNKGNALFHSMEHTNNSGVYRLLFDETNTAEVEILLATIDDSLDALGYWDNAEAHFRYQRNQKVNIVGIQPRGEQSDFWKKYFAGFAKATIPTGIDTAHLHQPPKISKNNHVQPSYIYIAHGHRHPDNDSAVLSPTAAETVTQQTQPRPAPHPMSQGSPTQKAGTTSPPQ
jgi:hypothetical protein